jgi:hypothetical protein
VRRQGRVPRTFVDATISVIGNSDPVQSAIGQPYYEVKQSVSDNADWREVEDQFRAVLKGISDANLVRRQRLTLLAARAYLIGLQVARDPENAELRPHGQFGGVALRGILQKVEDEEQTRAIRLLPAAAGRRCRRRMRGPVSR